MEKIHVEEGARPRVLAALKKVPLFASLDGSRLNHVLEHSELYCADGGEQILTEGDTSDSFYVLLTGKLRVLLGSGKAGPVEVAQIEPPATIGELGLLLESGRNASIICSGDCTMLRFDAEAFSVFFDRIPGFGLNIARTLASRLRDLNRQLPLVQAPDDELPPAWVQGMLPVPFQERHRVIPMKSVRNTAYLGFVDPPRAETIQKAQALLPGMELCAVRITQGFFEMCLSSYAGLEGWGDERTGPPRALELSLEPEKPAMEIPQDASRLDLLLYRMVAEGASDLHLSPGHRPRWRIDGELRPIEDARQLEQLEAQELLAPVMTPSQLGEFEQQHDADFAYGVDGLARFRVNIFRNHRGAAAVLRQIPDRIMNVEQLGLPSVVTSMCDHPKGLVLVTGPTGSGKSTTLAAMIDKINHSRRAHIITLEDPIEFVYHSDRALVSQREVGAHAASFGRALRAALREDPDIVLVGEMRDLETVSLALETAATGHLVFGTLHTTTAINTVDRIIEMFPAEQQPQVRVTLSECLRGVIAQTLCRRIGGGRVAALEILVVSRAVANLLREGKTHQLLSAMQTQKDQGNCLLNDELARLVDASVVEQEEALAKSLDKPDLLKRLEPPPEPPPEGKDVLGRVKTRRIGG